MHTCTRAYAYKRELNGKTRYFQVSSLEKQREGQGSGDGRATSARQARAWPLAAESVT